MKPLSYLLILTIILIGMSASYAQGDRCSSIQPFCAGDSRLIFENSSSAGGAITTAEPGPSYGCLVTQPFPAWFYLQVRDSGNLEFQILQSQNPDGSGMTFDVDFIVWGPFEEGEDFCSDSHLSVGNTVDCSYSPSAVERMTINGARENQIYVVLITNFSGSPGYISLQQTNSGSGGSTDCSIVENTLGPDQQICGEDSYDIDATNPQATSYTWYVLDDSTGEYELLEEETEETLTVTETGNYSVTIRSDLLDVEFSDEIFIEFFDLPVAVSPPSVVGCESGEDYIFDLTNATADLIGDNSGNFSVNFYLTREDYEESNAISAPSSFTGDEGDTILGTIINEDNGCESLPVEIRLEEFLMPQVDIPEVTAFCVDLDANILGNVAIGEDLGPDYTYSWNVPNDPDGDGVQNPVLELDAFPSQNPLILSVIHNETGCETEYVTQVTVFSRPMEVTVEVEGSDFDGGYQVTATAVTGYGEDTTYEYRLDDGPWQEENVFNGVAGGTHTVTAREVNGCGTTSSRPFRLVGYPRFFTPNNDGYNDTWNVLNDSDGSITRVIIFDRYGKLIKQLNPRSGGWDGTFNGRALPADDYWFSVEFRDGGSGEAEIFKGHFSLIR